MKRIYNSKILILLLSMSLYSCSNSNRIKDLLKKTTDDLEKLVSSAPTLTIANVTIASGGASGEGTTATVFFDSTQSSSQISALCANTPEGGTSVKPCQLQYSWSEINESTGVSVVLNRTVFMPVTTVQPYLVTAAPPEAYDTEIPNGTVIKIKVVPAIGNPSSFEMANFLFTKGTAPDGDFTGEDGESFQDIQRYSCFEKVQKGVEVISRTETRTSTNGDDSVDVPLASGFCVLGETNNVPGCPEFASKEDSAQSYYYNLFIPGNSGDIAIENKKFFCPRVKEALDSDGSVGENVRHWPLDATFALSQNRTAKFTVETVGPRSLGIETDPDSGPSGCPAPGTSATTGTPDPTAISYKCLGFAMKPNTDGTCSAFKDSSGKIRQTFRLRRFLAKYPPHYTGTGAIVEEPPKIDMIYVLDREVAGSDNPEKPFTMLGPKPCPFAYLDRRGTLDLGWGDGTFDATCDDPYDCYGVNVGENIGIPVYRGTNNSNWANKNVDGTHFPDDDSEEKNSCSAVLPIVSYDSIDQPDFVTLGTTHSSNSNDASTVHTFSLGASRTISFDKVYIRPVQAWTPHYVEDESFQACAPRSENYRDPPLHFQKDTEGNISWCAEAYPTQNDNVDAIDRPLEATPTDTPVGFFKNFTSHVVKHSASGTCSATLPTLPSDLPSVAACNATYPGATGQPATCGTNTDNDADNNYYVCRASEHPSVLYVDSSAAGTDICANVTCDRTVVNDGLQFVGMPLLADPADVETALKNDFSYNCKITYDGGLGKEGKETPSSGCCGTSEVTSLTTGKETSAVITYRNAHLEPDRFCTRPEY